MFPPKLPSFNESFVPLDSADTLRASFVQPSSWQWYHGLPKNPSTFYIKSSDTIYYLIDDDSYYNRTTTPTKSSVNPSNQIIATPMPTATLLPIIAQTFFPTNTCYRIHRDVMSHMSYDTHHDLSYFKVLNFKITSLIIFTISSQFWSSNTSLETTANFSAFLTESVFKCELYYFSTNPYGFNYSFCHPKPS